MSLSDAHYFEEMSVKKYEEIRKLLDSREKKDKLEGMKRLLAMISIGRDASDFFPDVVKNVVSDSLEVKKLVYTFLTHYAESKSNEALLTINTFQKDLSDTNQLIRSSALRVMTSIRVSIIAQLQVMAVKQCVRDSSAYVRKAAAHAVGKVYSLDPEQGPALKELIIVLLQDNSTMVLGSAVAAFNEVCPEELDMLHGSFRKMCRLCADTDEWGQITLLNTFIHYGRRFFLDPNQETIRDGESEEGDKKKKKKKKKGFYSDDDSSSSSSSESSSEEEEEEEEGPDLDPDHAMLLSATQPLLRSRNSGVVMAVVTLFHYLAPREQVVRAGKSLVRVLKNNRETQYLVLANVATLVQHRKDMFAGAAKEFFLRATDPTCCSLLKLEILSQLVTEANAQLIMKEFNAYIKDSSRDPVLVAATIQAIGRVSAWVPSVTESCLRGLMQLISTSKNEAMVAESVVVVRTLVQQAPESRLKIIRQLIRALPKIQAASARASIVWMVGAYHHLLPLMAPDTLRELAKSFKDETAEVKLQVLNLACKLWLSDQEHCKQLVLYVLELARYDTDFDLRDRTRLVRNILLAGKAPLLQDKAAAIFLSALTAPEFVVPSKNNAAFTLNTLSHTVGHEVPYYQSIPDFPEEVPDGSIRDPVLSSEGQGSGAKKASGKKDEKKMQKEMKEFYSGSDSDSDSDSSDSDSGSGSDSEGSASDSGKESGSDSDSDASSEADTKGKKKKEAAAKKKEDAKKKKKVASSSEEEESSSESDATEDSDSDSEAEKKKKKKPAKKAPPPPIKADAKKDKKDAKKAGGKDKGAAQLIDLGGGGARGSGGGGGESLLDIASPASAAGQPPLSLQTEMPALAKEGSLKAMTPTGVGGRIASAIGQDKLPVHSLLHFTHGGGLSVDFCFTREKSLYSDRMSTIRLTLQNTSNNPMHNIQVGNTRLEPGMELQPFTEVTMLSAGASTKVNLYIDFGGKTKAAKFDICLEKPRGGADGAIDKGTYAVSVPAVAGELVVAIGMEEEAFDLQQKKLRGMHENQQPLTIPEGAEALVRDRVLTGCNLYPLPQTDAAIFKFAGAALTAEESAVLLTVDLAQKVVRGNSEATLLCRQIVKDVKEALGKAP